jgi:hypothetical protein
VSAAAIFYNNRVRRAACGEDCHGAMVQWRRAYLGVTRAWSRWKPSNAASPERATYGRLAAALVREPPHPGLYSRNSRRRAIPDLQKPSLAHAHGRRVFPLVPLAPRAWPRISRNYVQCWRACMLHTKQTTRCSPQAHQPTHTSPHFTMLGCRLKGVPEAALGLYVAPLQWPCACTWSTSDHNTPSPSWAATLQPPSPRAPDGLGPPHDTRPQCCHVRRCPANTMAVLPGACHGSRAHDLRHHHRQQWTLGPVTSYC